MKAVAIILNFFIPGVGSLVIGRVGSGIAQLLIYVIGLFFTFTLIGAILGIPMMLAAWIWGLVTAATYNEVPAQPMQVHIVHTPAGTLPHTQQFGQQSGQPGQPYASTGADPLANPGRRTD